ncbi:uncharacterized protein BJ171DRAFT_241434 [Polychytrium aggregatum]|uniref:uncharacterized protein n=1 Tax=Polychytrium aggregatum TaxID=110093 RepID=UPI0022FF31BC|nr:uncharacterized protein BJ171DRAFT_241434 [Polychytrium aggregatum]KAI9197046.1 hypothetical protein BJ171DRAFT_241434 [Polychytrium aggregatum]
MPPPTSSLNLCSSFSCTRDSHRSSSLQVFDMFPHEISVYNRLVAILESGDVRIQEIGFVPTDCIPSDDNPNYPFVLIDDNLGISTDSISLLFEVASAIFQSSRKLFRQQSQSIRELCQSSKILVLLNPEIYSVWNARKDLLSSGLLQLQPELELLTLVFSKFPKSTQGWNHRHWIMRRLKSSLTDQEFHRHCQCELDVCDRASERHKTNYHAWTHRRKIVDMCPALIPQDLILSKRWCQSHLSDYSGWHHRQSLLRDAFTSESPTNQFSWIEECIFIEESIQKYPGYEALWLHLRFVVGQMLTPLLSQSDSSVDPRTPLEDERRLLWGRFCSSITSLKNPAEMRALHPTEASIPDILSHILDFVALRAQTDETAQGLDQDRKLAQRKYALLLALWIGQALKLNKEETKPVSARLYETGLVVAKYWR